MSARAGVGTTRRIGVVALTAAFALAACSAPVPDAVEPEAPEGDGDAATATDPGPQPDAGGSTQEPDGAEEPGGGTGAGEAREAPDPALQEFYDQELTWEECDLVVCAELTVPVDYEDPEGGSIEVLVAKFEAEDQENREGSLVVNPGGPGGSGVELATYAGYGVFTPAVVERYDIVGFDPRGVGGSEPLDCVDDRELDEYIGLEPDPEGDAVAEGNEVWSDFIAGCEENGGELLEHMSSRDVVRDMDVLRAALEEDTLDYLGYSYGTVIGSIYADTFPDRVGRLVLDGAALPNSTSLDMGLGQAEGFERASRAYVEWCIEQGECVLGDDVDEGMQWIADFLDDVGSRELPTGDEYVETLTGGWAETGVIAAMYSEDTWGMLSSALESAEDGDGSALMTLANMYAGRSADGSYATNTMEAFSAVSCLDRPDSGEEGLPFEEIEARFTEVAPTWGPRMASEGGCALWPVTSQYEPAPTPAEGADPILVIGTTRDPATPYEWAVELADMLDSGVLLTYDGDGHTAYNKGSSCIDEAVEAYLLEGTVPEEGTECQPG